MVGKGVFGVVVGHHTAGAKFADDRGQFAGQDVDIVPPLIVLSVFQNGEIDARILLAKRLFLALPEQPIPDGGNLITIVEGCHVLHALA